MFVSAKMLKDPIEIKGRQPLGFLVVEPENLKLHYVPSKKKAKKKKRTRRCTHRKRKRQTGFLSRYDFAYAGKDVVNQAAKVAPGVIKAVTSDTNNIAQDRINQIISQGGKEVEHVLPKILRGAIEDVYQTPFRVLRNFGKQQFN